MGKELCFYIDGKELYLEQVLVDYMEVPIFFLCKGGAQFYLALCTDLDVLDYVVVKLSVPEVSDLLNGRVSMRDSMLHQEGYWEVISGEEISMDTVKHYPICELDEALLPEEGACFEVLTSGMEGYIKEFDAEYQNQDGYGKGIPYVDMSHLNLAVGTCFDLGECLVVQPSVPAEIIQKESYTVYCEKKVKLKVPENLGKWSSNAISNIAA